MVCNKYFKTLQQGHKHMQTGVLFDRGEKPIKALFVLNVVKLLKSI